MSAKRTPAEMADWLQTFALRQPVGVTSAMLDAGELHAIAAYLRRQPTDAQKMEALKLVASASYSTGAWYDAWGGESMPPQSVATEMAHDARQALRLLDLPTGDER